MAHEPLILRLTLIALSAAVLAGMAVETPWIIGQSNDVWTGMPLATGTTAIPAAVALKGTGAGQWTSAWHKWDGTVDVAELAVRAAVSLFTDQTIEVVVRGSEKPYTDLSGVPHTWYGRCMIAIVDRNRWIMAIRSGISHIAWRTPRKRDTIHILTSNDEGRTWSKRQSWGCPWKTERPTVSRACSGCRTET